MLNAHQLNVFLIAADTLNFTQAAQRLQMSQPSVSQHIQALEQHFGLDLFIRSGRSLLLTDAGRALVPLARELVFLSNHIEDSMTSIKGMVYGHLLVGCSTTVGRYVLPQLLAAFHRRFPEVRATCQVTSQETSLQLLCEGKVHLALTTNFELCADAEYRKMGEDNIHLIAPLDHPWNVSGKIQPGDLYEQEFILPEDASETHNAVREALAAAGISIYQLKCLMTLGSPEAIALSVQEGLGVGFVSEVVVKRLVRTGVVPVCIEGLPIRKDVYLGRNPNRPPTAAQAAFWDFVFTEGTDTLINMIDKQAISPT
jgi:DNA-binding transcriptional LysR family regulator